MLACKYNYFLFNKINAKFMTKGNLAFSCFLGFIASGSCIIFWMGQKRHP